MNDKDIPLLDTSRIHTRNNALASVAIRWKPLPPLPSTPDITHLYIPSANTFNNWRPPTRAYLPLDHAHASRVSNGHVRNKPCWLPYTITQPFLLCFLTFACLLLVATAVLHVRSDKHHGLGEDRGQSVTIFGWRFAPTLLAVVFSLVCGMLLDDVKRTEPYTRLTRKTGGPARSTVLQTSEAWWNALADGFKKSKNNGSYSWSLILSAVSLVLALFVLSPLSAALLVPDDILVSDNVLFQRMVFRNGTAISIGDQVEPRFRTISNLISNVDTSVWVTDDFMAMPFGLHSKNDHPLLSSTSDQVLADGALFWHAETTILRCQLDCQPMQLKRKMIANVTDSFDYVVEIASIELEAADGCIVRVFTTTLNYIYTHGGAMWVRRADFPSGLDIGTWDYHESEAIRVSDECVWNEFIFVTSAWLDKDVDSWSTDLRINGQACLSTVYQGVVPVVFDVNRVVPMMTFSDEHFNERKGGFDAHLEIQDHFDDAFFSPNWTFHFRGTQGSQAHMGLPIVEATGPSSALFASYNFSTTTAIEDTRIESRMARIKQRYLGEMMRMYLLRQENQHTIITPGTVDYRRKRIRVNADIAIVMEIVISIEIVLISALYLLTRPRSRPLDLLTDPAKTMTVAALVFGDHKCTDLFKRLGDAPSVTFNGELRRFTFRTQAQELRIVRSTREHPTFHGSKTLRASSYRGWRPFVLHKSTIIGLMVALIAMLGATATLYSLSRGPGLYQKGFVYSVEVVAFNRHLSTFTPFSVIPTLLAIGIAVWWGAMETNFRILQPYLNMATRPSRLRDGMQMSYQSSYLFWAVLKAVSQRNWLLSLVCTGAILAQVLTITMSALWQQEYGILVSKATLERALEIRTMPLLSTVNQSTGFNFEARVGNQMINDAFADFGTTWLYSAIIQMTMYKTQRPWTADEWNFVPLDLSSIMQSRSNQTDAEMWVGCQHNTTLPSNFDVAIHLTTPALTASLDCSPYALFSDSNWLISQNFSNTALWDADTIPSDLKAGHIAGLESPEGFIPEMVTLRNASTGSRTSILADIAHSLCCENQTAGVYGQSLLAYWSVNFGKEGCYSSCFSTTRDNFTVKYIQGRSVVGVRLAENATRRFGQSGGPYMAWYKRPRITALNCRPKIQRANASVVVDPRSGIVQAYSIISDIHDDEGAWSDGIVIHKKSKGANMRDTNVTTSYGYLFTNAVLHAAAQHGQYINKVNASGMVENPTDMTFAFKQPGLNMDYMSYAMYSQAAAAGQAATLSHDPDQLYKYANVTFTTFFQNFVNSRLSLTTGGWAYQPIGQTEPMRLNTAVASRASSTPDIVEVEVHRRVKMLRMSPVAAWLSMSILIWLIATTIAVLITENRHLDKLIRGVSSLAEVAVLVAGSQALLQYVRDQKTLRPYTSDDDDDLGTTIPMASTTRSETKFKGGIGGEPKTKLGWFRDGDGRKRWGIELYGPEYGVEWLSEEEVQSEGDN